MDREILRLFIEAFDPIIRKYVIQNKNIPIGFFLSVMESKMNTPSSINNKDEFFLKEMGLTMYVNDVKRNEIEEILKKTSILNLTRISPKPVKSRHVVIAISGFLTEDVDKKDSWRHIVNHYKNAEVFALTWNSLSTTNFFNEGAFKGKKRKQRVIGAFNIISSGKKQFKYCLDQARVAGTLLATFLLKTDFSSDRAIIWSH